MSFRIGPPDEPDDWIRHFCGHCRAPVSFDEVDRKSPCPGCRRPLELIAATFGPGCEEIAAEPLTIDLYRTPQEELPWLPGFSDDS